MKRLTAKREETMGFFWRKGPLFVKEILTSYEEPKPHFNALSTIIRGLGEEGFLDHSTSDSTYQYCVMISVKDFKEGTLENVISRYFDNSYLSAVSSPVNKEEFSLDDLKQLIQDVEEDKLSE